MKIDKDDQRIFFDRPIVAWSITLLIIYSVICFSIDTREFNSQVRHSPMQLEVTLERPLLAA